ncbi:hypothetical protein AB0B94_30455 [Micromonospora sp. NPDC048986]|uniref:hypothetical protein n=1 Tax=Micromonospora sp. NPDC048986 TaxID=3155644 RepID=UPI0033C46048
MKAITLRVEWAYAVAHLGKTVENRVWYPPKGFTGDLAIHVGSTRSHTASEFIAGLGLALPDTLPTSVVVAVVHVDGHHIESECDRFGGCSPWAMFAEPGAKPLYHWELSHNRPLTPVPAGGALGLWELSPAVDLAVHAQLATAVAL